MYRSKAMNGESVRFERPVLSCFWAIGSPGKVIAVEKVSKGRAGLNPALRRCY
jgi:hypothetical protein